MIRTESFTIEKQRALLDAFGELPFTVIWKGEEDKFPAPIPKNIYFDTWLPQLEILCSYFSLNYYIKIYFLIPKRKARSIRP